MSNVMKTSPQGRIRIPEKVLQALEIAPGGYAAGKSLSSPRKDHAGFGKLAGSFFSDSAFAVLTKRYYGFKQISKRFVWKSSTEDKEQ
jgi:hypothetical protein